MHIPSHHRWTDTAALHALLDAHPLGAWVAATGEGLAANHLPWLLDRTRGPLGTLLGHVARANPVVAQLAQLEVPAPSVVLFQGPQAYVTPSWYPSKAAHGQVVPTWNYAVAHVHGSARVIDDAGWLRDVLARLTAAQEAAQPEPWAMDDAPPAFIDQLLGAVVGIEIPIERLVGKLKAGQDETRADALGAADGLDARHTAGACPMAAWMRQAAAGRRG